MHLAGAEDDALEGVLGGRVGGAVGSPLVHDQALEAYPLDALHKGPQVQIMMTYGSKSAVCP